MNDRFPVGVPVRIDAAIAYSDDLIALIVGRTGRINPVLILTDSAWVDLDEALPPEYGNRGGVYATAVTPITPERNTMSDTITTTRSTTRVTRNALTEIEPNGAQAGDKVRCDVIEPGSLMAAYQGKVATVIHRESNGGLFAKFEQPHTPGGASEWYLAEWTPLPEVGTRVTVTAVNQGAAPEYREWAVGREATFHSVERGGLFVKFDTLPAFMTPRVDEHVLVEAFTWGGDAVVAEPVVEAAPVKSVAERDRDARRAYDRMVEAVNDMAVEQEWCGQFEEWAERHDVPVTRSCSKDYSLTIDLTYEIDADTIATLFAESTRGNHDDVNADCATVVSTVYVSVTTDEDPSDMDSYEVESALHDAGYENWSEWEITTWDEV